MEYERAWPSGPDTPWRCRSGSVISVSWRSSSPGSGICRNADQPAGFLVVADPTGTCPDQNYRLIQRQETDSTVLQFYSSTVLRFYGSTVLRFYGSTVLRFYSSTVLRFYSSTVLQFYSSTVLQFYSSTVLQFYSSTVLQFYGSTVLQFYGSTVLQFYSSTKQGGRYGR